jgi:hypothetical protein
VEPGAAASLSASQGVAFALSPDGTMLTFVAQKGPREAPQLYVRRLGQLQAVPLLGTQRSPAGARDTPGAPHVQARSARRPHYHWR